MGVFEWHGLHWAHTRHEGSQETCHCRGSLIVAVVVAGRSESKGAQVYSWLQCDLGSLQFVRRSNTIPAMAGSGWSRGWWWSAWNSSGRSSWEAGLTAEQELIPSEPPLQQPSRVPWKRDPRGSSFGRPAESWEDLPPQHVWTYVIHANLADIPREWWAQHKKAMQDKYDCNISYRKARHTDYRKARHTENDGWVLYRLTIRGIEAMHCSEELLDAVCTEHPQVVKPWDIETVPLRGEAEEAHEQTHGQLQGFIFKFGGCGASANNKWRHDLCAATVEVGNTVQTGPSKKIVTLLPRVAEDPSQKTSRRQA